MNKQEEIFLFEQFQKHYSEMPLGTVEFDDKPDVIVTLPTCETIGIELTECIYDEDLMKESEHQIKFINKVIEHLEKIMPFKFYIDVELDKTKPIRQNNIVSTLDGIAKFCLKEFAKLQNNESEAFDQLDVDWSEAQPHIQKMFRDQGYRKLPGGILRIRMTRFDILSKSNQLYSKGGSVPNFTQKDLQTILDKKEKSLKQYKRCDQHWLVIGEASDFYSYINNIEIVPGFNTCFDKVFMYRRWSSLAVILK